MAGTDVIVVGGGHNGLVAAILAAQAGKTGDRAGTRRPTRRRHGRREAVPAASRSAEPVFLPDRADAGRADPPARHRAAPSRPVRSRRTPRSAGTESRADCWWSVHPGATTEESFRELTGSAAEYQNWQQFYAEMHCYGKGSRADVDRPAAPPGGRQGCGDRGGRGADLDRCRGEAHRRSDHPAVPRRHGARRGGHRRGDRHAHLAVRPRIAGESMLSLSPDRPRHRGMAGAGRRNGRADRCAGRQGALAGRRDPLQCRGYRRRRDAPRR